MKFVAIDFETANKSRSSVCAVGLSFVEDGKIVDGIHQLIRPDPCYFDPLNVSIHGITQADVRHAPSFGEAWSELAGRLNGPLVAHNAAFDMSVLRQSLDCLGVSYPAVDYFCTRVIAKLVWPHFSCYRLDYLAQCLEISFHHHNALEDARACAQVALHACHVHGFSSLYGLRDECGLRVGALFESGYTVCGLRKTRGTPKLRAACIMKVPTVAGEHTFTGKCFAFTSSFREMSRQQAMQAVVDRGGICHNTD